MQHSLWADTSEDEAQIYFQFLNILKTIEKPSLIHYGSFETDFFKQMGVRYGISVQSRPRKQWKPHPNKPPVNNQWTGLLSNILKRSEEHCSLAWLQMVRHFIDRHQDPSLTVATGRCRIMLQSKLRLLITMRRIAKQRRLSHRHCFDYILQIHGTTTDKGLKDAVYVEALRNPRKVWRTFESEFKEFEKINVAAWWNYQRDRIWVRPKKLAEMRAPQLRRAHLGPRSHLPVSRTIIYPKLSSCPSCG